MKTAQQRWSKTTGWSPNQPQDWPEEPAQLVLAFGGTEALRDGRLLADVRRTFPAARLFGCSTAGEIAGTQVTDDTLVVTAIRFADTRFREACIELGDQAASFASGANLARLIPATIPTETGGQEEKLVHVFVLSDGLHVNGSELVRGLTDHLPEGVSVTGGLAGDGERFGETLVLGNGTVASRIVAALGLYGSRLRVGFGSLGGWDPFGTERLITRSVGNVLYELDGQSALGLYRQYLGEHAKGLPATGLLFPLSLRTMVGKTPVVRTILAVDEAAQSLTFAGDVPEGAYAQLMKANFDRLIDGAVGAATICHRALGTIRPELALLISCVGRKLVLRQRIEEEVEGVREVLGRETVLTGFYSYGEISPFTPEGRCELHNQTMTITVLSEE